MIYLALVAVAITIALIILWRWFIMNTNQLLYIFVEKMIDKVDSESFWAEYGDMLMEKLVDKLF